MFKQSIQCPKCNTSITIDFIDFIEDEEINERNMGKESIYHINYEDYACQECGCTFSISGHIAEYPEGDLNNVDLDVHSNKL